MNNIDHLVVAAQNLTQGVDYIQRTFGVDIPPGGFHQTMGTHNHLMQLGNNIYLEVITIDAEMKAPDHPRWFALDDGLMRASLVNGPRLITWVMNTNDIQQTLRRAGLNIGEPTVLSRNQLSWEICLTDDGRLLANGLIPYVIQWRSEPHPANAMADLGCRLLSLQIYHNRPAWIKSKLVSLDASHLVSIHALPDETAPYLAARIETPGGEVCIDSRQ